MTRLRDPRDMTIAELEALLEQRKKEEASLDTRIACVPVKRQNIDFSSVIEMAEAEVRSISETGTSLEDFYYGVAAEVLHAVFGRTEFEDWYYAVKEKQFNARKLRAEQW